MEITSPLLKRLLAAPRNEWPAVCASFDTREIAEAEHEADDCAVLLAEIGGYLLYRGGAWHGDYGHGKARDEADKRVKRIRKVLGYAYP